ncbi:MAG TPA: AbrB/MazE/SpoVT family DNA-binding domain-containing protein [Terriglobales bacterium]|nr:AbrB/MazE/SpoVT family DNA-binding domain-containing protein [Terriglobales bacterium]
MQKQAKITSKGQITIPQDIRRLLGVRAGDRVVFRSGPEGVRVLAVRQASRFAKYRGIGNPGIGSGKKAIGGWLRESRGK